MSSSKIQLYNLDDSVINSFSHKTQTITLTVSAWNNNTQTVAVSGITSDNTVIVSSNPESFDAYSSAKIKCTAQSTNSLTFICDKVPTTDIKVNIVILEV